MLRNNDFNFKNFDNYECIQLLGQGTFSIVYKFNEKDTNKEYAFKFLNMHSDLKKFINAIDLFKILDNSCIKKIHYQYLSEKDKVPPILQRFTHNNNFHNILIISDFEKNRDLGKLLIKDYKLTPTVRSKIIFGIAYGMKYLHEHKLIIRDLKPGHILLNENYEPIINICSSTEIMAENNQKIVGTPLYMSPEALNSEEVGYASDVYSYSIILYSLFSNKFIFENGLDIIKERSLLTLRRNIKEGNRFKRPDKIPDVFWSLIQECWKQVPEERPTFKEITEKLKGDEFILEEFGQKTDLEELREYQRRVESDEMTVVQNQFYYLMNEMNQNNQ